METEQKSIIVDFLRFIGILPLRKPRRGKIRGGRIGYPLPYLDVTSKKILATLKRESKIMREHYS